MVKEKQANLAHQVSDDVNDVTEDVRTAKRKHFGLTDKRRDCIHRYTDDYKRNSKQPRFTSSLSFTIVDALSTLPHATYHGNMP